LVGSHIYLAQNTDSIYKAIRIAEIWFEQGYNPGENPTNIPTQIAELTLYRYINENDIVSFRVKGVPTPHDIRILGYKIDDMSFLLFY
jgi:hypothetical protein